MTIMSCHIEYGYINAFNSFVHIGERTFTDKIPFARQLARDEARKFTKQCPKRAAYVSTIAGKTSQYKKGKHINYEYWVGGYQIDNDPSFY